MHHIASHAMSWAPSRCRSGRDRQAHCITLHHMLCHGLHHAAGQGGTDRHIASHCITCYVMGSITLQVRAGQAGTASHATARLHRAEGQTGIFASHHDKSPSCCRSGRDRLQAHCITCYVMGSRHTAPPPSAPLPPPAPACSRLAPTPPLPPCPYPCRHVVGLLPATRDLRAAECCLLCEGGSSSSSTLHGFRDWATGV